MNGRWIGLPEVARTLGVSPWYLREIQKDRARKVHKFRKAIRDRYPTLVKVGGRWKVFSLSLEKFNVATQQQQQGG